MFKGMQLQIDENVGGIENSFSVAFFDVEASHLDQSFCHVMVDLGQVSDHILGHVISWTGLECFMSISFNINEVEEYSESSIWTMRCLELWTSSGLIEMHLLDNDHMVLRASIMHTYTDESIP